MEIIKVSDKLLYLKKGAILKDNIFATRFMKNQFKNIASLDRMYPLLVRVVGNGTFFLSHNITEKKKKRKTNSLRNSIMKIIMRVFTPNFNLSINQVNLLGALRKINKQRQNARKKKKKHRETAN